MVDMNETQTSKGSNMMGITVSLISHISQRVVSIIKGLDIPSK